MRNVVAAINRVERLSSEGAYNEGVGMVALLEVLNEISNQLLNIYELMRAQGRTT